MIKTWQERIKPEYHSVDRIAMAGMQAEIDELRAENAALRQNNKELLDQRFELMTQISRLHATAFDLPSMYNRCVDGVHALRDENEKLRAVLKVFADALPADRDTVKTCYAVTNAMRDAAHAALEEKA